MVKHFIKIVWAIAVILYSFLYLPLLIFGAFPNQMNLFSYIIIPALAIFLPLVFTSVKTNDKTSLKLLGVYFVLGTLFTLPILIFLGVFVIYLISKFPGYADLQVIITIVKISLVNLFIGGTTYLIGVLRK